MNKTYGLASSKDKPFCKCRKRMPPKRKRARPTKEKAPSFEWTDERTYAFLTLVSEFQRTNTNAQACSWILIKEKFEEQMKVKITTQILRNKHQAMRAKYTLWSDLKDGETVLGWDPLRKTIAAPSDWWDRKLEVCAAAIHPA